MRLVCAGIHVAAQLAHVYEWVDLDPSSFACTHRARAFGRLLVSMLPNAAAHSLALREMRIHRLQANGQRFAHGLRQSAAVLSNPIFFNPGRATHIASNA